MTEITKLLEGKEEQEFDVLMYGKDYRSGLFGTLTVGLVFDDMAIECICCLIILKRQYDLLGKSKNTLYRLYCMMQDYISKQYPEIKTSHSVFTRPHFAKFLNAYPQILQKPLNNHRD